MKMPRRSSSTKAAQNPDPMANIYTALFNKELQKSYNPVWPVELCLLLVGEE